MRDFSISSRATLWACSASVSRWRAPGDLGPLRGALGFDFALLLEPRALAFAFDVERLFLRLQVARTDLDHRFLFDVVALLALGFDVLDQPGQTFGVELVGRVEELKIGLVDIGDGDGFKLKAVLRQRLGGRIAHPAHIVAALLVHLVQAHFRRHRAQGRDELAGEQGMQPVLLHGAAPERRRGDGDRFVGRRDTDIELRIHVDPHAVPGDERVVLVPDHLDRQDVHVDGRDVVDDRPHEGAAVDHHFLAEKTSPDKGHFLCRTAVQPMHHPVDDGDDDDRQYQPENEFADQLTRHFPLLPCAGLIAGRASHHIRQLALICLNFFVCSVSATSVGRRSMEEAP